MKCLYIDGHYLNDQTLQALSLCQNIEKLNITGYIPESGVKYISKLSNLKVLTMSQVELKDFVALFSISLLVHRFNSLYLYSFTLIISLHH